MKLVTVRLLTLISLWGLAITALGANPPLIPAAPQISASSYILMDAHSGHIIVEENAHQRLPPASLTKMMTSYIVDYELAEGNVKFADQVPISVNAWKTGGSKMFVREGTQVELEELLKGIIIQSGNDASVAVAEYLAGSEDAFASIMNQHATRLGMQNTNFQNATGLPAPEHYSTAYDLALLARAIIFDFPEQYPIYSERSFTFNNIKQSNRNLLLWRDKSVDGLKTGHTEEAGYCLVSSAVRDGMRLISVVMGARNEESRAQETLKLLNYGFRYFETHRLYEAGDKLLDTELWAAQKDNLAVGVQNEIIVTVPRGQKDSLEASVEVDKVIKGPVETGTPLGLMQVKMQDQVIVEQPVVALESVEEAGFFKRLWHSIVLFVLGLFE